MGDPKKQSHCVLNFFGLSLNSLLFGFNCSNLIEERCYFKGPGFDGQFDLSLSRHRIAVHLCIEAICCGFARPNYPQHA